MALLSRSLVANKVPARSVQRFVRGDLIGLRFSRVRIEENSNPTASVLMLSHGCQCRRGEAKDLGHGQAREGYDRSNVWMSRVQFGERQLKSHRLAQNTAPGELENLQ